MCGLKKIRLWRMPIAEFEGTAAWLEIGRLAWNLGKWTAQLAVPPEVVRWEWKRGRSIIGGRRLRAGT